MALAAAGFEVIAERDRRDFALDVFDETRARAAQAGVPPPLGIHILMGASAPLKAANLRDNITAGRIAPVEIIARRGT